MKKFLKFIFIPIMVLVLALNYKIIFDPSESMHDSVASENYFKWKIDLLLWLGADPLYRDGATFKGAIIFKHYELIKIFSNKIPMQKRVKAYSILKELVINTELDGQLQSALGVKVSNDGTIELVAELAKK
ncbi:hypothetical protein [Aliikangiella maris]|uniref:Uncharacterized protein n=2 Tax=Aliikangiella maris TaxID=3162458 RepID=A0ABV2C0A3_9GAMM